MKRKELIQLVVISIVISAFIFVAFVDEKTLKNFLLSCCISLMYSFTIGYGNHFVTSFLEKKFPWEKNTRKRAIITIISIVIVNVILVYSTNYVNFVLIQKALTTTEFFTTSKLNFINWFYINIALLISAFLHAKSFMEELQKSKKKEVQEQKIIATSANAQFETLKNQLDPHFLFNSLNVLSSLIEENPEKAVKFTNDMSKVYRYVLEQKDKKLVTVKEEINFALTYCSLLKMRFEDSVDFIFDSNEDDFEKLVVPLSLQLLLENCIKHNFATSSKPLIIKVYCKNDNLVVENNLQPREQLNESSGIGLNNIVQRYSLLTNLKVTMGKTEDLFTIKLPLLTTKPEIMKTTFTEKTSFENAQQRVQDVKDFYTNLIMYFAIMPFIIFINVYSGTETLWFLYPLFGWAIGILIHAFYLFVLGNDWEENEIHKLMNKKNNNPL